jgi:hypothetical protein
VYIYIWLGPTLFEGPNLIVGITKIDTNKFTILPQGFSFRTPHSHPLVPTPFSSPIPQNKHDTHITYMGCGAAGGWAAATLALSSINASAFGQFIGIDQDPESLDIFSKRYPQTKTHLGQFGTTNTLQQAIYSTILIHSGEHQTLSNKGRGLADPSDTTLAALTYLHIIKPCLMLLEHHHELNCRDHIHKSADTHGYYAFTTSADTSKWLPLHRKRGCTLLIRKDLSPNLFRDETPYYYPPETFPETYICHDGTLDPFPSFQNALTAEEETLYSPSKRNHTWPTKMCRRTISPNTKWPSIRADYRTSHYTFTLATANTTGYPSPKHLAFLVTLNVYQCKG